MRVMVVFVGQRGDRDREKRLRKGDSKKLKTDRASFLDVQPVWLDRALLSSSTGLERFQVLFHALLSCQGLHILNLLIKGFTFIFH
jgi:hypothetical protein